MKLKSLMLILLVLAAAVFCAGCGSDTSAVTESDADVIGDTLVIGMSLDNAPFGWVQDEATEDTLPLADGSGHAGGYDVQIAKIIALLSKI